ncbi:hypothetical protein AYI68_g5361 [Smittium mucronatum]|uniref:Uncharacterized protein n=1 Tax=Smittium mucronatum TaxID=133383 RepID=A0A1R0GUJ4_9FUNG|nr:hypothetical protein AYI68_g5361 [Smittium mucronatum]
MSFIKWIRGCHRPSRSESPWTGVIPALKSLLVEGEDYTSDSMLVVASSFATQQQFRSDDLYQSNWYGKLASDNTISMHLFEFSSNLINLII